MCIYEKKGLEQWALELSRKGHDDKAIRVQRVANRLYSRWYDWVIGKNKRPCKS